MSGARLALTLCVTKAREGSEVDMEALERMFRYLKFESTMKRDPTAQVLNSQLHVRREAGLTERIGFESPL
jgi:caspase 14